MQIKEERTPAEFCWTCTPIIIEYVFSRYKEKICTYIDADIYFFSDPIEIIQEIIDSGCSVGLVRHGFERGFDYSRQIFLNGKYCIEFNTFINDSSGRQVLADWRGNCLAWCYARYEDGKYGDQKYTDKWKAKYSCIHEVDNYGVGVAPWNVYLYSYIDKKDGKIEMEYKGRQFQLILYHFEGIKYFSDDTVYLNLWKYYGMGVKRNIKLIYRKYFKEIVFIRKELEERYDVTFRHLEIDKQTSVLKQKPIKFFWAEYGFIDGIKAWTGWHANNIMAVKKLC